MMKVISELRSYCLNRWPKDLGTTHGVEHWDRVARFGKMLYQVGVDMDVVTTFAYLHDSERMNNAKDIDHGLRASKLIDTIRRNTIKHKTGDITIDTCFDADRMDLFRVGIKPSPERMATKRGAELVADPYYEVYYNEITCTQ